MIFDIWKQGVVYNYISVYCENEYIVAHIVDLFHVIHITLHVCGARCCYIYPFSIKLKEFHLNGR